MTRLTYIENIAKVGDELRRTVMALSETAAELNLALTENEMLRKRIRDMEAKAAKKG
tara:strand:- start:165 stop:335 length:171 start_codon:yes stop_codon:yes gene_type:complete